jgi:hypothetical protein
MHARELVELAALVSAHGAVLIRTTGRLSASGVEQYWSASKCRADRWSRGLKNIESQTVTDILSRPLDALRPLVEEILAAEVLTRVWAGVLVALDRRLGTAEVEPLARSVMATQMEARQRVLNLIVHGPGVCVEDAVTLNRLRRRCERWSDLLIGHLLDAYDVSEFAIEPDRAWQFAEDLRHEYRTSGGDQAWNITLTSLRAAFHDVLGPKSPNADLNCQIASGILASFPPEMFDSTGVAQSLWLVRMSNTTTDAQGMIEELLAREDAAVDTRRWSGR